MCSPHATNIGITWYLDINGKVILEYDVGWDSCGCFRSPWTNSNHGACNVYDSGYINGDIAFWNSGGRRVHSPGFGDNRFAWNVNLDGSLTDATYIYWDSCGKMRYNKNSLSERRRRHLCVLCGPGWPRRLLRCRLAFLRDSISSS